MHLQSHRQAASRGSELAALLAGALTVFGFAPYGVFPLPLLTLAILFHLWQQTPQPGRAAWIGFLWGLGYFLTGISWIYIGMHDVSGMSAPLAALATLAFSATLALFPALAGWLFVCLRSEDSWRNVPLAAATWMLGEWLRGWVLTGFPWLSIGYSQNPPSPLAGYAAVVGVYGLGFICAALAGLAAFPLARRNFAYPVAIMMAILAAGFGLQHVAWTQPIGAPLTVSLLQGNIPQAKKWDRDRLQMSLDAYLQLARTHPADLLVLPETALPTFLQYLPHAYLTELTANRPALIGVPVAAPPSSEPTTYANGAVAIINGAANQTYAKGHLVPFGEYAPTGFSWFVALMHIPLPNFVPAAASQPPLEIAGQRIAPSICYEDLFGEELIQALPQATLLVNLSNMAWFGDSLAQAQHLQIARMRALESGRSMVRATNTGMTAAIAPDGQIIGVLPGFTAAGLTVKVQGYDGLTPYARWGNRLALLTAALALLPAILRKARPRSR